MLASLQDSHVRATASSPDAEAEAEMKAASRLVARPEWISNPVGDGIRHIYSGPDPPGKDNVIEYCMPIAVWGERRAEGACGLGEELS